MAGKLTFELLQEAMDAAKEPHRVRDCFISFKVLAERCPLCGDNLIHNNRGIECGNGRCEYVEKGDSNG